MVSSNAYALLSILTFSATLLMVRAAGQVWPPLSLGAYSRVVTVLLMGAYLLSTGRGWRRLSVTPVWRPVLVMGCLSISINALFFCGLAATTATNAAVLYRLDLLFVMLIGTLMGYERIRWSGWLIAPVMALGVCMLLEVQKADWRGHLLGDLMIVTSAFGLAINAFIIRSIVRVVDVRVVALYNFIMSGLGLFVLGLWQGSLGFPAEAGNPTHAWLWMLAVGVIIAFQLPLYYAALHRMAVWKLRALMMLSPLMVALVEILFLHASLNLGQWFGSVLIIAGAGILVLQEHKQTPTVQPVERTIAVHQGVGEPIKP